LLALSFPSFALRTGLFRLMKSSQETLRFAQGLLGVARLRRRGGQVEAQWIGVVFAQEVGHVHSAATALAELAASEIEVLMITMHKILSL